MNRIQRIERDNQIADAWKRRIPKSEIAAHFKIDPRTVDRAIEKFTKGQLPGSSAEGWEVLEDTLAAYEDAAAQAASIGDTATSDRVRISAIRTWTELTAKRLEIMLRAGLVPSVSEGVLSQVNAERVQLDVARLLREGGWDVDAAQAVLSAIAKFSEIPEDDVEKSAVSAMEKAICATPEGAARFVDFSGKNPGESVAE